MDRSRCKTLTDAVLNALKGVEEEFNVKVSYRGGNYGSSNCQLKFEFAEVGEDGEVKTRAAEAWKLAVLDGLPEGGLGSLFSFRGRLYKVTGYKPGCKYNITAERQPDKRGFKFEAAAAFGKANALRT